MSVSSNTKLTLAIVVGTRPEIIKMSSIINLCSDRGIDYFILHTGQHYDYNLDQLFFEDLELPAPKYNLQVGSGSFSQQVGSMMIRLQDVLSQEHPSYILAEGDTNTVLATSLVASHMNIPLVHVEAGLRSGNMLMQEERNRIVADRLADLCFAPTEMSYKNLMKEQIEPSRVFVVGNTIVDALGTYLPKLEGNTYLAELGISSEKYILTTVHRAENTGCRTAMQGILHSFELFNEEYGLPIIFPAHPRTEAQLKSRNMSLPEGVQMVRPLGWFDFLALQKNAKLVLTDSGGVQEECCLLHVPCLTLRQETERPETVDVGANILTGTDPDKIIAASREMLRRSTSWVNPFGGGDTASQILGAIAEDWDKNQGGSR